jgi:gamma-glutamyltranspeptidase/glutathione hydrolase
MSPTFVESDAGVAVLGTPGGSRIITMVLLAILNLDEAHKPQSWVSLPRFHHQFLPDLIQYEPDALPQSVLEALEAKGHNLKALNNSYGNMQAIYWDYKNDRVEAASDPRGVGSAQVH